MIREITPEIEAELFEDIKDMEKGQQEWQEAIDKLEQTVAKHKETSAQRSKQVKAKS